MYVHQKFLFSLILIYKYNENNIAIIELKKDLLRTDDFAKRERNSYFNKRGKVVMSGVNKYLQKANIYCRYYSCDRATTLFQFSLSGNPLHILPPILS